MKIVPIIKTWGHVNCLSALFIHLLGVLASAKLNLFPEGLLIMVFRLPRISSLTLLRWSIGEDWTNPAVWN